MLRWIVSAAMLVLDGFAEVYLFAELYIRFKGDRAAQDAYDESLLDLH